MGEWERCSLGSSTSFIDPSRGKTAASLVLRTWEATGGANFPVSRRQLIKNRNDKRKLEQLFRSLGINRRYRKSRKSEPGNHFTTILTEAFMATGETIFLKALEIGSLYGFNEGQALRTIRRVGALRASAKSVAAVDGELRRQSEAGKSRSFRKAYEHAALETGVEAPTLEAARKKSRRRTKRRPTEPSLMEIPGVTYSSGPCEIAELTEGISVAGKATWHPDNLETRRMLGKENYVVFSSRVRDARLLESGVDDNTRCDHSSVCSRGRAQLATYNYMESPEGLALLAVRTYAKLSTLPYLERRGDEEPRSPRAIYAETPIGFEGLDSIRFGP